MNTDSKRKKSSVGIKTKKKIESFNFIDLFSGVGGLSVGLEAAGLVSVLGIDNDQSALETYKQNHKNSEIICGDIREIETSEIRKVLNGKKVRLICGGPPCQGFSTVGRNNPLDNRNHLFLEFVRVVRDLMPDYILVENVTGLLSRRNENTLLSIIESFAQLGYSINVKVLSAHHYGVAETRRRTIILGNKFGIPNLFPTPKHKNSASDISDLPKPHTVKWAFDNFISHKGKGFKLEELAPTIIKNRLELERLKHIPEGKGVRYEADEKKYLPKKLWFEVDWTKISEGRFRQTKLQRLSYSKPSPTINTFKSTYYHPTEHRYLTPREAAAIQSFPSKFKLLGTPNQQWRHIGNAVPPILAKAIGESIKKLDLNRYANDKVVQKIDISGIRRKAFKYREYASWKKTRLPLEF